MSSEQKILTPEEALAEFVYLVYTPNPPRDNVRCIVDGELHYYFKREAFIELLKKILNYSIPEIRTEISKMEMSILEYGGWFYYSRPDNQFKELMEIVHEEKLMPAQIREKILADAEIQKALGSSVDVASTNRFYEIRNNRPTTAPKRSDRYKKEVFRTFGSGR